MNRGARRGEVAGLAVLAAAALLLRVWRLPQIAPSIDDLLDLYRAVRAGSTGEWISWVRANPLHSLVDPWATYLAARASSSTEWLRLPSVLFGVGSVLLLRRLGAELGDPRLGWLSASLLALSPFHVEWCRRINFYSAFVFVALASTLALWRAVETGSRRSFAAYALLQALAAYTHPFSFILLALHGVWIAAWNARALRPWAACAAVVGLSYLPWWAWALRPAYAGGRLAWAESPARPLAWAWQALRCWSGAPEESAYLMPPAAALLQDAAGVIGLAAYVLGLRSAFRDRRRDPRWLFAAIAPPVGLAAVAAVDAAAPYFFAPKQTIFVVPFFLLTAAKGVETALAARLRPVRLAFGAASAAFALSLGVSGAADSAVLAEGQRNRLAELERLRSAVAPGDVLLLADPETSAAFLYDYDRPAFFRLSPPRGYGGASVFDLPEELWIQTGSSRNRAFCLAEHGESGEQRRRRWKAFAPSLAGKNVYLVNFFRPGPVVERFAPMSGVDPSAGL